MRDVSQQMMRASTSFAEGAFILSSKDALLRSTQRANFASSFLGVRSCFFYPPLLLEIKCKGGEEVSMFLRTKRVFSTTKSKERKRGRRFSALRDRKRERENDPRA